MDCPSCSKDFESERSMKIHHKMKHGKSLALEKSFCKNCEDSFIYYPSEKPGKYCSSCSKNRVWSESIKGLSGEENPNWSRKEVECSYCGNNKMVKYSVWERNKRFFCNFDCVTKFRKENWQGEDHPLWRGGEIENYGHGWIKVRNKARERDDYSCVCCGKQKEEIGYGPPVHHIKPVREYEDIENAHFLENVVSLCPTCHANAEHGNITREELYQKI